MSSKLNPRSGARRSFLKTAAAAGGAALAGPQLLGFAEAWARQSPFKPESGARLSINRATRFFEAEGEAYFAVRDAFTRATGVKVIVQEEWIDDIQPKSVVSANAGVGTDMTMGLNAHAQQFPDACVDVTDVADYLGGKYGWMPLSEVYGKNPATGRWIQIPTMVNGNYPNYRISHMNAAGFSEFPGDTDGFLELCRALKAKGTPAGFTFGHATGDSAWLYWLLFTFGGKILDSGNKVALDSPESVAALEYGKKLHAAFISGTESWHDGSNNKAFLAEEVSLTSNGASIYGAAVRGAGKDPNMAKIRDDMDHAHYPVGPAGRPTELPVMYSTNAFKHTKYPEACKAFLAFFLEADNFRTWSSGGQAYVTHTLQAHDDAPVWSADPKYAPYRDATRRGVAFSYDGPVSVEAAGIFSDFVVADMFGEVVTGQKSPPEAAKDAARRAQRLMR